jgi:hypothetical protein
MSNTKKLTEEELNKKYNEFMKKYDTKKQISSKKLTDEELNNKYNEFIKKYDKPKQYIYENHINTSPKNIYNMEPNNEPTVEKKQRKPRQPRQPRKPKLSLEEKEINRLIKKMEKVDEEIGKKYERYTNLKTLKAKQKAYDAILRRFTELKNVYGILIKYGLEDDYRVRNMEGQIRHLNHLFNIVDEQEPVVQEPKALNKLHIYNQYINALLFVAGYDLNTGNDDDIRMMSYYLEQVFPEIIKYNVYNIKKSQATKILEDIRKYIEDTDNDTHFKILESLDTTNVTKTLPNEKKQALLDTLGTIESPLIDLQYEPMPEPLVIPQAPPILLKKRKIPKSKKVILQDIPIFEPLPKKKYTIPTDLQVINIDEHVPSIIPKDKGIAIKLKPKTPVKKKRSYKELTEATVRNYINDGYEYTIITFKDGEVIEKKRKLLPHELLPREIEQDEDEDYKPSKPTPQEQKEIYRNKLNKMTVQQLMDEYIRVGVIQDKSELDKNIKKDKLIMRLMHTYTKGLDL